jgi:hypothetical protein
VGIAHASTVVGLSIEDQARLSKFVVVGEVVSLVGSEHPQHGIETEVTLEVTDALMGRVSAGDAFVFHTRSGAVDGVLSHAEGEADLRVGQKVLVFVEEIGGRRYNLGLSMGVFHVQERDGAVMSFTRAITDGLEVIDAERVELGPITYRDMASRVAWASRKTEFDSPVLRESLGRGR